VPDGMTGGGYQDLPATARRRMILRATVRPALTVTVVMLLYYLLPLEERFTGPTAVGLLLGLVIFVVLLTWQVRQIRGAQYPRLRAIEALSLTGPLFLVGFAVVYLETARNNPAAFSEALNRTDSLYFALTVFASVGFGDITAVTQTARVLVMIQMVGDLILVGVVARVVLGAVQLGLRRQRSGTQPGD
jgi:voltage-gated potassium channel